MKLYLNAPATYWNSSFQVREAVCNGAGPRGFGWMVPDRLFGLSITEAADIHDWMYWEGKTEDDKQKADMSFLSNMIRIVNNETTEFFLVGFVLKALRKHLALTYYDFVFEFGHRAFWGTQYEDFE